MLYDLVATFDSKTAVYSKPVAVPAVGAGVRAFADAVNDKNTEFSKHPEDYSIWHLGQYNDVTGEVINLSSPLYLASAVALLKPSV